MVYQIYKAKDAEKVQKTLQDSNTYWWNNQTYLAHVLKSFLEVPARIWLKLFMLVSQAGTRVTSELQL